MMRFNAGQRKVAKIVLIGAAALLLLGLIMDARQLDHSIYITGNLYSLTVVPPDLIPKWDYSATIYPHSSPTCLSFILKSFRLYAAGLLLGLAVFIHKDTTKD